MKLIQDTLLVPVAKALRSGALDLMDYVDQACDRLERIDPQIEAFLIEQNRRERLNIDAQQLLEQYPDSESRPPLFGVMIGVKDIFHADGYTTRAGSNLPVEALAGAEAAAVTVFKQAGALILGKTVTTEFAYFEPGATRNPHNLDHTPGGSSSGSAAAVAAGLCPVAFGSQTGGSINRPAAYCGVVGLKPTFGRISRNGVVPISESLDHVGLFTQDAEGMILASSLLLDSWKEQEINTKTQPVIGVPDGPFLQQADIKSLTVFETQLERLMAAGYIVQRVPMFDDVRAILDNHMILMSAEMAQVHKGWFAEYEDIYRLQTAQLIREGQGHSAATLEQAQDFQRRLTQRVGDTSSEHGVDLWASPAARGVAPKGLESTGTFAMNFIWTQTGVPSITLRTRDTISRLPLGFQLAARRHDDERLLAWSKQIEQVL